MNMVKLPSGLRCRAIAPLAALCLVVIGGQTTHAGFANVPGVDNIAV